MSDAIKAAVQAERAAFRAILARVRALLLGRDVPSHYVVDVISSELDDRERMEEARREFD